MDNSVYSELKRAGQHEAFDKLNSTYGRLSDQFAPLLKAQSKASTDMDYIPLLNTFLSRPGKTPGARFAVDDLIETANEYGLSKLAKQAASDKLDIQVVEAAKAFNPIKPGQIKADAVGVSQLGLGMWAALSMHPAMIGAIAGAQMLRQPQTARYVAAPLYRAQQVVSNMTKKELNLFLSDPRAMNTFMTGATAAPLQSLSTKMQLDQMINQAQQQGQPPQ